MPKRCLNKSQRPKMLFTLASELVNLRGHHSCRRGPWEWHPQSFALCNVCNCTCLLWPLPWEPSLQRCPPQYTGSFSWQSNLGMCVCKTMCRNIPFVPSDVPDGERRKKTNMRGTSALSGCWTDVPGGCSIYVILLLYSWGS